MLEEGVEHVVLSADNCKYSTQNIIIILALLMITTAKVTTQTTTCIIYSSATKETFHLKKIHPEAFYVGHLESKERLRIQPAQLFNFS